MHRQPSLQPTTFGEDIQFAYSVVCYWVQPLLAYQLHLLARPAVGTADAERGAGTFQAAMDVEAGNHQFALLQQMTVNGVIELILGFAEHFGAHNLRARLRHVVRLVKHEHVAELAALAVSPASMPRVPGLRVGHIAKLEFTLFLVYSFHLENNRSCTI